MKSPANLKKSGIYFALTLLSTLITARIICFGILAGGQCLFITSGTDVFDMRGIQLHELIAKIIQLIPFMLLVTSTVFMFWAFTKNTENN
jgi:hypothetical protein